MSPRTTRHHLDLDQLCWAGAMIAWAGLLSICAVDTVLYGEDEVIPASYRALLVAVAVTFSVAGIVAAAISRFCAAVQDQTNAITAMQSEQIALIGVGEKGERAEAARVLSLATRRTPRQQPAASVVALLRSDV